MTAVPIETRRPRQPEPQNRRTLSPVRRLSKPAGGERWEPMTRAQANRRIFALKVYREKLRKPGQRWGAEGTISAGAVGLYELLCNMAVRGRGRVEPSVAWLARACNVPAKVVHAWKTQLKDHGFLDWRRRWVETGVTGSRGPQVQQTSNAYWLQLPMAAWAMVEKLLAKKAPPPEPKQASPELQAQLDRLAARVQDQEAVTDPHRLGST